MLPPQSSDTVLFCVATDLSSVEKGESKTKESPVDQCAVSPPPPSLAAEDGYGAPNRQELDCNLSQPDVYTFQTGKNSQRGRKLPTPPIELPNNCWLSSLGELMFVARRRLSRQERRRHWAVSS